MLVFPRLQQTPDSRPLTDVQRYLAQLVAELNRDRAALDEQLAASQAELDATQAELDATQADLAATQASLAALEATYAATPIVHGLQTGLVSLAAAVSQNIPHGLGRPYLGWIIVRVSYSGASAAVVQEASGNPDTSLYVRLNCAQPVSLVLWVF